MNLNKYYRIPIFNKVESIFSPFFVTFKRNINFLFYFQLYLTVVSQKIDFLFGLVKKIFKNIRNCLKIIEIYLFNPFLFIIVGIFFIFI